MMTFVLFAPASTRWLGWRKDRKSRRDRLGRFCDIYCTFILRHSFALRVISDILWWEQLFWKLWTKTHSLSADEVIRRLQLCIYKHLEFARHEFTNPIGNLAILSFSLFDWNQRINGKVLTTRTMDDYRNSPTIKFCADLFHGSQMSFGFKVQKSF